MLASKSLHRPRFSLRVRLPLGDVTVRVTTVASGGRRASTRVHDVFALPAAARPRVVEARLDRVLARRLDVQVRGYAGTAGYYVQSLSGGSGAAWNAKARFPAASTVKLAIAATVLARYSGIPSSGSYLDGLLRNMIVPSDDAAANALLVWLGGSTSSGAYRGKYTSARDMASLWRAIWLASGGKGPLRTSRSGFTAADARHLLWLTAHVRDRPKLDTGLRFEHGVHVLHKAGWISTARHDTGLVFWSGGVFVAGVMTYRPYGVSFSSDRLAGRVARLALARFRRTEG
jgi:hypothetical protein